MANPVDNTKYFEAFRSSMTDAAEKLSGIHVSNMEKMIKLQIAAVGKYSELGVEQMKELSTAKDRAAAASLRERQHARYWIRERRFCASPAAVEEGSSAISA